MKPKLPPIPKAAMPVVRIIREKIRRPDSLFELVEFFDVSKLKPTAAATEIFTFYSWLDSIPATLAQQAVDAVWGKRRKR